MSRSNIHHIIYLISIALLAIALPVSKYLMSLAQLIMLANWLIEGKLNAKFRSFFRNMPALIISSLFLLHILGLLHTSDFAYAFKDLRTKLPLLALPLIISSSPRISKKQMHFIFSLFIASVIIATCISYYILYSKNLSDTRDAFPFISHIRFSLNICMAVFFLSYFIYNLLSVRILPLKKRILSLSILIPFLLLIWLLLFLVFFELITGISIIFIVYIILSAFFVFSSKSYFIKYGLLLFNISVIVFLFSYLRNVYYDVNRAKSVNLKELMAITSRGNIYTNDTLSRATENGYYTDIYICEKELEMEWNRNSSINYSDKDLKGQALSRTLIRYLTSKGLRKDADGVNALSPADIHAIESGIANCSYINFPSLYVRLHQIFWEFKVLRETGYINAHSVIQRFEFWRASLGIIRQHFWCGVGTGDLNSAFKQQYEKMNSSLDLSHRWRSHNQYLSILVAFGICGFFWFILSLLFPMFYLFFKPPLPSEKLFSHIHIFSFSNYKLRLSPAGFLYLVFLLTIILSMLTEDTIETQAGVTFFAFFNSFLFFSSSDK